MTTYFTLKTKNKATAIRLDKKKWVAAIKFGDNVDQISSLEWVTKQQAVEESASWHRMLKESGRDHQNWRGMR